jgi:3-hydroxy-9,10-secoandrosta-1,3,5(10)-triene-9,17-dione monooxygenase
MSETQSDAARRPWAGMGADYAAVMERAEALVPMLRERAGETETLRNLPEATERAIHEAGLFRIMQPKRFGGAELPYVSLIDVGDILARGDASVAWNVANLASHHWMLAMWPKTAQDRIWGENVDTLISSSFVFPAGRAARAPGGYTLSGRWPFSSGVSPSTWNMLAGIVVGEDGVGPEHRVFLVPASDYEMIDTWHALGLKGTGSHDVKIGDVFVPEHMTVPVSAIAGGPTPGSEVNPGAVYRIPVFALFPYVLSGPAAGNAQACVDDYVGAARGRNTTYNAAKLADLQPIQIKIAAASARVDAARMIMRGACIEAQAEAEAGRIPDMLMKTRYRRDGAFSVNLCTEAVDMLFAASGARGLYMSGATQRQFRDAHAIAAHISFSFDAVGSNYGRIALGLSNENPIL